MKKQIALLLVGLFLWLTATACGVVAQGATELVAPTETATEMATEAATEAPVQRPEFDPYAKKNVYKLSEKLTEEQEDTDYGTVEEDVKYYSKTAGDYKYCNVLLPPGYNKKKTYPVLYLIHGWQSGYDVHLCENSYLHILYGNMMREKQTVPMIIVSLEMYTDKLSKRAAIEKSEAKLLAAYNKVIEDIPNDLMPFIEKRYPVRRDRASTAIMGVSQGGTKALAAGFANLDRFGYIASFAPDPGTVPTGFLKGTIWNKPLLKEFPAYEEENDLYYLYLAVGADDPENVEVTKYYGSLLKKIGFKNQTDVVKGYEHDYIFWRVGFYNFLNKIFRP